MRSLKFPLQQTRPVAVGQLLCSAVMIAVFALLGKYSLSVLLGGLAGAVLATANFFIMSWVVGLASEKAAANDSVGGQKLIQLSYMGRMLAMFAILVLLAKSGLFHPLALVLPLAFTRPVLTVSEIIHKKKGGVAL